MLSQCLGLCIGPVLLSCVTADCSLACGSLSDLAPTGLVDRVLAFHTGLLCHSPKQRSSFGNDCLSSTGDKSMSLTSTFKAPHKLTQPNWQIGEHSLNTLYVITSPDGIFSLTRMLILLSSDFFFFNKHLYWCFLCAWACSQLAHFNSWTPYRNPAGIVTLPFYR